MKANKDSRTLKHDGPSIWKVFLPSFHPLTQPNTLPDQEIPRFTFRNERYIGTVSRDLSHALRQVHAQSVGIEA